MVALLEGLYDTGLPFHDDIYTRALPEALGHGKDKVLTTHDGRTIDLGTHIAPLRKRRMAIGLLIQWLAVSD
jgi:hypothetical protein